jgi:hypothetical protein
MDPSHDGKQVFRLQHWPTPWWKLPVMMMSMIIGSSFIRQARAWRWGYLFLCHCMLFVVVVLAWIVDCCSCHSSATRLVWLLEDCNNRLVWLLEETSCGKTVLYEDSLEANRGKLRHVVCCWMSLLVNLLQWSEHDNKDFSWYSIMQFVWQDF